MYIKIKLLFLLLILTRAAFAFPDLGKHPYSRLMAVKSKKERSGILKASPAFYWKTAIISSEFKLSKKMSAGITVLAKYGLNDHRFTNFQNREEAFLKDGLGAEVNLRYYFGKKTPEGLYLHTYAGYNQIRYFDGSVRPYTLLSTWDKAKTVNISENSLKPLPYHAGLGTGFQFKIIPERLMGDVLLGLQGNIDQDNSFFLSVFLLPSIGYRF